MPLNQHTFSVALKNLSVNLSDKKMIVGVSGGIDSIVLCHLLQAQNIPFEIAHVNYGLRGKESDVDEEFVRDFAESKKIVCHIKRLSEQEKAELANGNIQENARELRYSFFNYLLDESGQGFIVLAHHGNDQAETILHRFFRGGMFPALRGMKALRDNVLRPLLEFNREDIEQYAGAMKLQWREDSSNTENKYTRNKLRNQIIPELNKIYPGIVQSLINRTKIFAEAENLINESMLNAKKHILRFDGDLVRLNALELSAHPYKHLFLWSILREYTFTAEQVDEVLQLIDSQSGKKILSDQFILLRDREDFIIAPIQEAAISFEINVPEFSISKPIKLESNFIDRSELKFTNDERTAYLSADNLKFPLTLRLWKEGDKFRPLGMTGHQKISDFLVQRKLSLIEKEKVFVLTCENEIVWVCGMRISEDYKITDDTTRILRMKVGS